MAWGSATLYSALSRVNQRGDQRVGQLQLRRVLAVAVNDQQSIFDLLVCSTRAMNVVSGKDTMRDRAYTFVKSPEQLRLFGARGGKAYGRNQIARRALSAPPAKAIVPPTRSPASPPESIARLAPPLPRVR